MNKNEKKRHDINWKWAQSYWKRKSKQLNIVGWDFQINHTKTRLAQCNYTKKKVCISSYFLRTEGCDEMSMRKAILHEIAHVLAGHSHNHDKYWKKICLAIGGDGKVCAPMDKPKGNYLMYCPNKCFQREYYRKPKLNGRLCIKCRSVPKIKSI